MKTLRLLFLLALALIVAACQGAYLESGASYSKDGVPTGHVLVRFPFDGRQATPTPKPKVKAKPRKPKATPSPVV